MALNQITISENKVTKIAPRIPELKEQIDEWNNTGYEQVREQCEEKFYQVLSEVTQGKGMDRDTFQEVCSPEELARINYLDQLMGLVKLIESHASKKKVTNQSGGYSSFTEGEKLMFVDFINSTLQDDPDLSCVLPIDPENMDVFQVLQSGVVLCKLINHAVPGTIDMKIVHKGKKLSRFQMIENLDSALSGAKAVGLTVVNISPQEIIDGKPSLVMGVLWQIMRLDLLSQMDVGEHVGLLELKGDYEDLNAFLNVSKKELLTRWINHHMMKFQSQHPDVGSDDEPSISENLGNELRDGTVYLRLLSQVAPHACPPEEVTRRMEQQTSPQENAEYVVQVLSNMESLRDRIHVKPEDLSSGNSRINLVLLTTLFQHADGLDAEEVVKAENRSEAEIRQDVLEAQLEGTARSMPGIRPAYITAFMNTASALRKDAQRAQKRVEELEAQSKANEEQLHAKEREKENADTEIQQLRDRVSEREKEIEQERESRSQEKSSHESMTSDLESKIAQLKAAAAEVGEKFKSSVREKDGEICQLQKDQEKVLQELDQAKEQGEKGFQEMKGSFDEMQKKLRGVISEKESIIEQNDKEISELERKVHSELEPQIEQLAADKDQLQEENDASGRKIKDMVGRLCVLRDVLKQTREDLNFSLSIAGPEAEEKLMKQRFPSVGAADIAYPDKAGWITKQGARVRNWRKRYFILKDNYLFYYGDEKASEPKGFLRLDDCEVDEVPKEESKKDFAFKVACAGRTLYAFTASQQETTAWIFAIRKAASADPFFN
eukprot:gb/GECH01014299.1/.p1 GENE.gb/GECH01014299.1/~~gb/GECH01014299.1/.p1  ORF type:complete len:778 (+),score=248.19 gb/GECH01014299.1/:1-2334(+)